MTVNQQVGQAIVEARTRLGISQYRLAKNLGWSSQRLSHYEKGRTTDRLERRRRTARQEARLRFEDPRLRP